MATTWTPLASVVQTTIPNDFTGNSVSVAPVSGDSTPVSIKLSNASTTLFSVDATGKLSAAASSIVGNETVGGTLSVAGATSLGTTLAVMGSTTLAAVTSTGSTVNGNESIGGTLTVTGAASLAGLTATGSQINGNESITGTLNVGGVLTASGRLSTTTIAAGNGTTALPAYAFTSNTDTGAYLKTASTSAAVLGLSVNATDAMTLSKTGVSVPGTLAVSGNATANIFGALALGAAGSPVLYSTQTPSTGIYFTTTPAMVFTVGGAAVASVTGTSVNVAQLLNAQAALSVAGAATLSSTLAVSGTSTFAGVSAGGLSCSTLNASGAASLTSTLSVSGASTLSTVSSGALTSSGAVKGTALTITQSGGALTFGDGTTQTTAATSGAAGQSALFAATSNGSNTAPVFSSKQYTNSGLYFNPNNTTSTNLGIAVDGTAIANWSASSAAFLVSVGGTSANFSGNIVSGGVFQQTASGSNSSFAGGLTVGTTLGVTGATTLQGVLTARQGNAATPGIVSNAGTTTGLYMLGSPLGIGAAVNGTQVTYTSAALFAVTGSLTVSANTSLSGTTSAAGTITSSTAAGTPSFVSTQGFKNRVDMGHVYTTSTTTTAGQTVRCVILSNGSSPTSSACSQVQDFAGSVVGICVNNSGAIATTTTVQLYKNGSAVSGATAQIASNGQSNSATFAKGTYSFAANDTLQAFVTYGASGYSLATSVTFTVEIGA